jgi:hypothetical protein
MYRTTQKLGRVRAVPRLCGFYLGISLTTGGKARENLSQGNAINRKRPTLSVTSNLNRTIQMVNGIHGEL